MAVRIIITVIHEYALLLVGTLVSLDHLKHDVLQACCLSDLPVNASSGSGGHSSEIDNEVADLTEEVVGVGVPNNVRAFSHQQRGYNLPVQTIPTGNIWI